MAWHEYTNRCFFWYSAPMFIGCVVWRIIKNYNKPVRIDFYSIKHVLLTILIFYYSDVMYEWNKS